MNGRAPDVAAGSSDAFVVVVVAAVARSVL